jgi:hypothetical protein
VIQRLIDQFKLFIEEQSGWKLLWNDDGTDKPEEAAQLLFRGIVQYYCIANNIVIDREVEIGRGPVDIKFSNGYSVAASSNVPTASTLIFTACFGVFMAFVFYRAGESVIATIMAHLSLNIMTAMGGVRLSSFVFWTTLATIFSVAAIGASIAMSRSARGMVAVDRGQTAPSRPLG